MKFNIYGKDNCQYCTAAVTLLTQRGIPFNYFALGEHFTREELLEMFPNARTFPQIKTESGEIVGGYTDLVRFVQVPSNDNTAL